MYLEYQLNMVSFLGIYHYYEQEFLDKSKSFFAKNGDRMVKNEEIFEQIDEALRRETSLNRILEPSENTVNYLQK